MQDRLNEILRSFNLDIECIGYNKVRNISLYNLALTPGTRIKLLHRYLDEIALMLKSKSKPLVKLLTQQGIVRLEVVDEDPPIIPLYETRPCNADKTAAIPVYLGSSTDGQDMWMDLARNPHMLVAGCTGSGKSTLIHTLIANLLPLENVSLFLSDPKGIDFLAYENIGETKLATDYRSTMAMIASLQTEMEYRYALIRETGISPQVIADELGYQVFIIDELADLIMQDEDKRFRGMLCRLVQKCRASGIYCIAATQRPSSDILSGTIKANFPARLACQVASSIDARVVMGQSGAELLSGNGDAMIKNYRFDHQRFQIAYTTSEEVIIHNRR